MGYFVILIVFLCGCDAFRGLQGDIGPRGIAGERGEPGQIGPQGPPGADSTESGTRLRRNLIVGEDGSREPVGWYDSQLMTDCSFVLAADGELRCLPMGPEISFDMKYLDANCTEPAIAWGSECPPAEYFRGFVLDPHPGCSGFLMNVYKLDPNPMTPITVYDLACQSQPAGDPFYAVIKLDPSSFHRGASAIE